MTKDYFKKIIISIVALTVITFTGCSKGNNIDTGISDKPTSYFSVNDKSEKTYYQENSKDVIEVKKAINDFFNLTENRSYEKITGIEEYNLYSKDLQDALINKKDPESTRKFYKDNKLETTSTNVDVKEISFSSSFNSCKVKVEREFKYLKAKDDYLKSKGFKLNTVYKQTVEFDFVREPGGNWQINGYTYSKKVY